jgi:hypothetical protein
VKVQQRSYQYGKSNLRTDCVCNYTDAGNDKYASTRISSAFIGNYKLSLWSLGLRNSSACVPPDDQRIASVPVGMGQSRLQMRAMTRTNMDTTTDTRGLGVAGVRPVWNDWGEVVLLGEGI